MFEKINWSEIKTLEKKEKFEQIIWDAIKRIECGGYNIGEGKTAKVCMLEEYPEACLKTISEKTISKNRSHKEMEFLDLASHHNLPVPKPICSVETDDGKDYLFMETINGFSLEDLVNMDLFGDLPETFDFKKFFSELRVIVERMHEQRIYHRDLHWGNVLVDKEGKPIIIDFGDATVNHLSSEDPYREINAKGEMTLYQSDENRIAQVYKQVGTYLREKGFFEVKKGGDK